MLEVLAKAPQYTNNDWITSMESAISASQQVRNDIAVNEIIPWFMRLKRRDSQNQDEHRFGNIQVPT